MRRIDVVDDIDAANEGDRTVDHRNLAVQTAQAMAAEAEPHHLRTKNQHVDAAHAHVLEQIAGHVVGTETIDDDARLYTAHRGARQRIGDAAAGLIVGEDVGLQKNLALRLVDGLFQRRKILRPAAQEGDGVAGAKSRSHAQTGIKLAVSAA